LIVLARLREQEFVEEVVRQIELAAPLRIIVSEWAPGNLSRVITAV
jgi:hypothetical protein